MKRSKTIGPIPWSVRVIGEDKQQLGVMPLFKAHNLAKGLGLELIEIAPRANPPIWRLVPKSWRRKGRKEVD